jgi:enoyl-CoA hydratase/carnithine racemase
MTGAGDKAFISGADISQFEKVRANADAQREYDRLTSGGRAKLAAFPKPLIAKIRGFCLGGGLAVAMQADMRIAGEDAQFGIPAARLGIAYGFEATRRLVSLVGPAHARGILMTAERIGAPEALRIGLVNRIHPAADLDAAVARTAATIVDNAPLSVRAAKLIVDQVTRDPDARDMEAVAAIMAACFDSADYREGRTAFLEKRKPAFAGH